MPIVALDNLFQSSCSLACTLAEGVDARHDLPPVRAILRLQVDEVIEVFRAGRQ